MNEFMSDFIKTIKNPLFIAYVIKCIAGVSICYLLYYLFPERQFNWSIVSVLLVLSPEEFDSNKLALGRLKSNIIGATMGLLAYLAHDPNLFMLCAAVFATILLCSFLKLGNASRSALAALAIVFIQEKEKHTYVSALDRMLCVVAGCLVAMAITYLFTLVYKMGCASSAAKCVSAGCSSATSVPLAALAPSGGSGVKDVNEAVKSQRDASPGE